MAYINGRVILTTYKSWDDPPSNGKGRRRSSNDRPQTWRIGACWNCFKSPTPIRFFSDFHFKYLGVRSKFWAQYVSNLNFVLKFRFRIDGLWNLFPGVLALCSFFLRVSSQECPKCLETVRNKMLTVFSNLMVYVFHCIWSACFAT